VLEELRHRVATPFALLRGAGAAATGSARAAPASRPGLRTLMEGVRDALGGASPTPLDVEVGPHRRFDWTRLPLPELRAVGAAAGGTVNDVVLAVASGALRRFLSRRGVDVDRLEFRAIVPVSLRGAAAHPAPGNRVSGLVARLPLDEPDPWQRLLRVVETTHELKASGVSAAGDLLTRALDLLPAQVLAPLFRRAARSSLANIVITNVPGPRAPVYLLGARQLESYPVVPLAPNQALGIALLSYDDGLFWGFNSDWDALPDLHDLVQDVESGFQQLAAAALPRPQAAATAPPPGA
jgi:WS/DGAT/MGAT family acyltransferase